VICLDSDCIIDFLNGKGDAKLVVSKYFEEIVTTEINAFEIFFGIYNQKVIDKKEEESAKAFFEEIEILPYGNNCGRSSACLLSGLKKQGKEIEQNDCHIVSSMISNRCSKIITKNKKHFERIKGIKVISY